MPKKLFGRAFRGRTNFTTALVKSINTIPVRLYVGKGDGLKALGGPTDHCNRTERWAVYFAPLVENPPMVLGANGLTVLEMATGYGTFMSGGERLNVHTISQIHDTNGKLLFDFKTDGPEKVRALKSETVAAINKMLVQVPEWGTARRAKLEGIRAAGKTGTTQAYRDAWFVGYTGNYVAAVWFGNDNYTSTKRLTGGRLPAMTWQKFMTFAHQNIDILPIPFVDPLPESEKKNIVAAAKKKREKEAKEIVRPKVLSAKSQNALKALEKVFKSAPVIRLGEKIAGAQHEQRVQSN